VVVVADHVRLLRRRVGGHHGRDSAADGRGAGRGGRVCAGVPAGLCHCRAGLGPATAGQPDRLAVRRLGFGLVADHSLGPVGQPADSGPPPAAAGGPARRPGREVQLGASGRLGDHPAGAAGARRAAALATLPAGGGRRRGRPGPGPGGWQPNPGTVAGDCSPHRQPVRAGRGRGHGGGGHWLQRPGAVGGQPGGRPSLAGAALTGLPGGTERQQLRWVVAAPPGPWPGCWSGWPGWW
jgi:hypothetical protein